jgi:Protein of unknown function (DUF3187)
MHATYGWKAAARLKGPRNIRPQLPPPCTVPRGVPPLIRFGQWCLFLCIAQALLTRVLFADTTTSPLQESPQEIPSSPILGGPFPVRSLSPVQLLYFQFTPERAMPLPRGVWNVRFDLMEANILGRDEHGDDAFLFDFELTRANLSLQYGLFDRLAVGLEIPLLYTWKGFLDEPIKAFEDVTGFRRTIRFERRQHLFSYLLQKDGTEALRGTSGAVGIGDIAISAKVMLREEGQLAPTVAARFALKLPTGDDDRALGSGEVDLGLGLALEKTFGPVRLYFNTGVTIPTGNPFSGTGIGSLPMLSTFLTGEYRLTERFSMLVQLNGVTPPVRHTDLDLDRPTFEILLGFNWALPGVPVVWQAGFMEDLHNTNRTADFALFMSWSIFFGHRSSTPR